MDRKALGLTTAFAETKLLAERIYPGNRAPETHVREDMYKVIVERPRRRKYGDRCAARLRNDLDGPTRLGMRAGYGYREFNENLAPLRRYLRAQVGRPWDTVFGEICSRIDRRNTVQHHIHQHIRDFIATEVGVRDGEFVDLGSHGLGLGVFQELYVDPTSGVICRNAHYRSWRHRAAEREEREQAKIDARRRVIDENTLLLKLDDVWFRVVVETLPGTRIVEVPVGALQQRRLVSDVRFDVVLRRSTSRGLQADAEREYLYGSRDLYAVSKRQLSKRELKAYGLRSSQED